MATQDKKEYSILVNLSIFIILLSIVVISRIVLIQIFKTNTFKSVSDINEVKYNVDKDMTEVIEKVTKTMEEYYGINIYYGEVLKNILPQINANVLKNEHDTFDMLQTLNNEFSKYPEGLLKEIEDAGYEISIYLVDSFNNDNLALANRTSNGYFNIFISNSNELEKSIHHELYHILEYYMKLQFDLDRAYYLWPRYNPKGFEYANSTELLDLEYVYGYDGINELSFVTIYSKYSEEEDRAEIFSEMLLKEIDYENERKTKNIVNKMNCIRETLDALFKTVDRNVYWGN